MATFINLTADELFQRLVGRTICADVETTGLVWHRDRVIGIAFSCLETETQCYVPLDDDGSRQRATAFVKRLTDDPKTVLANHNIKFDFHFLNIDPNDVRCTIFDTMIAAHLCDSRQKKALETVEWRYLGTRRKASHLEVHRGRKKGLGHIAEWPLEDVADYATDDTTISAELTGVLSEGLKRLGLESHMQREIEYLKLLWRIERKGVQLAPERLREQEAELERRCGELERELYTACGVEFKWRSFPQLSKVLYEHLGLEKPTDPMPYRYHTTSKHYTSTATGSWLLSKHVKHPASGVILRLRETDRLRQTLVLWRSLMDGDCVLHTSYNQAGTQTYRLSSSKPNLQNIAGPYRREYADMAYGEDAMTRSGAYVLRQILIARPGYTLVAIDYSQQEARFFALLAGEQALTEKVRERGDVHGDTAELVFGTRDPTHRRWAKDLTFAMSYGMNAESLAELLGVRLLEAQRITRAYFGAFPRIQQFMREVSQRCTLGPSNRWGVRYVSGEIWRPTSRQEAYKGVNALVQGGCSRILRDASLRCQQVLDAWDAGHILLLVHDEIVFEIEDGALRDVVPLLVEAMETSGPFDGVRFFATAKAGGNYGSLEPWHESFG